MKVSSLVRIGFSAILVVFAANFAVLFLYFPAASPSPLRLSLDQTQKLQEQGTTVHRAKQNETKTGCSIYGCPIYPPELTNTEVNQSIWKALNSHDYEFEWSHSYSKTTNSTKESSFPRSFDFASGSFATLSQQGKSHVYNQDRAVLIAPFLKDLLEGTEEHRSFLVCIFDGHGRLGHEVAQELVQKFPMVLAEKIMAALADHTTTAKGDNNTRKDTDSVLPVEEYDPIDRVLHKALNETFLEVNEKGNPSTFLFGGSTGSVTLRWGSKLYVANTGDSQTILVGAQSESKAARNDKVKIEYETRKHKANQPDERARIEKLGGKIHVNAQGYDPRVIVHSKAADDTIGLAMSRSLGDWEWKEVGVTAEPTIDVIDLSRLDTANQKEYFVLAASDGFWDMRQQHFLATQSVFSCSQQEGSPEKRALRPLYHLYDIIQRITPKRQVGYRDDITATIVNLVL